jgi:membrane-associated phospholipid phosphatase
MLKQQLIIFTCGLFYFSPSAAQQSDTLTSPAKKEVYKLSVADGSLLKARSPYKPFIVPAFMIAYGFTAIYTDGLNDLNESIKEEVWTESPHKKVTIDNYLQYAPAAAVYGLNILGIKGKNNLVDRSMIYLISNIFLTTTVTSLKSLTAQQRPDGSSFLSFPSGHTAEAFASAEFMRQEYKDVSPWYGVAAYAAATATGYLRIYNNKHWLSDVVAGAGIGIASTKLAYLVYPLIKRKFTKNKNNNTILLPYFQNGSTGIAMVHRF